uniref:Uncharacterized protein n=1 Tax=Knipowitschia caucasica TaxID=637954 RepID=A0AAV2K3Y8_KNICA
MGLASAQVRDDGFCSRHVPSVLVTLVVLVEVVGSRALIIPPQNPSQMSPGPGGRWARTPPPPTPPSSAAVRLGWRIFKPAGSTAEEVTGARHWSRVVKGMTDEWPEEQNSL